MDKPTLIASLLIVGFENWSDHLDTWWMDGVEARDIQPTASYLLYVGAVELYVDFLPEEGRCCVDINEEVTEYKSYQEAWNHIKTLLPEE